MKRWAWNSTLPAATGPMRRETPLPAKGGQRFKVSGKPDKAYREWIRNRPCILLGKPDHVCRGPIEACHVKTKGAGGVDAANLFPACARAHSEQHLIGIHTFERAWNISLQAIATALDAVYRTEERWLE